MNDWKKCLKDAGLRYLDVANHLGCSYGKISLVLNGYMGMPVEWPGKIKNIIKSKSQA